MRIKIIGDNNCARATRHLVRLAGFAVTEFLPGEAVTEGPHAGYAITIELAPAPHTSDAHHRPDSPTHHLHPSASEEAAPSHRAASSPAYAEAPAGKPAFHEASAGGPAFHEASTGHPGSGEGAASLSAIAPANFRSGGGIHFDSMDSALEEAVLRHVTQLAAAPVIVDRPGGVVHSDRELRIVAPNTGDSKLDEAAAVAIEFGVLRGLLDLTAPAAYKKVRNVGGRKTHLEQETENESTENPKSTGRVTWWKKWWPFGIVLLAGLLGLLRASVAAAPAEAQGQFATGQGIVVDPCNAHAKLYASISQTGNTQIVAGTASKKIYVCSIHLVAAAATNVAVVEGTGTVCGTGAAGVSGFGGATAATGWNFAANGGIALGNGDSSLGAEGTSGDNLCIFNSGSGQVSGGISYVVQ